jgi:hypothetical protein
MVKKVGHKMALTGAVKGLDKGASDEVYWCAAPGMDQPLTLGGFYMDGFCS